LTPLFVSAPELNQKRCISDTVSVCGLLFPRTAPQKSMTLVVQTSRSAPHSAQVWRTTYNLMVTRFCAAVLITTSQHTSIQFLMRLNPRCVAVAFFGTSATGQAPGRALLRRQV